MLAYIRIRLTGDGGENEMIKRILAFIMAGLMLITIFGACFTVSADPTATIIVEITYKGRPISDDDVEEVKAESLGNYYYGHRPSFSTNYYIYVHLKRLQEDFNVIAFTKYGTKNETVENVSMDQIISVSFHFGSGKSIAESTNRESLILKLVESISHSKDSATESTNPTSTIFSTLRTILTRPSTTRTTTPTSVFPSIRELLLRLR